MTHNQISADIVDAAIEIHQKLGPGLLETVYHAVLSHELAQRGHRVESEVPVPVNWDGILIDVSFRADLIVDQMVLVELKSVETIASVHKKQVLTYIRLADLRLGLLLNFGAALMKDGIHRIVNGLEETDEQPE